MSAAAEALHSIEENSHGHEEAPELGGGVGAGDALEAYDINSFLEAANKANENMAWCTQAMEQLDYEVTVSSSEDVKDQYTKDNHLLKGSSSSLQAHECLPRPSAISKE